ncbi:PAS domain S-box-containing protein/diguanylate cyclase (GGDEF)-like protein [Paucimonas lemoignei]|uniref:PAS domain S-box-containing protein/diguanylate cyclase (GGDEF)-like protein n=1 Tax=Paucimonas lemoignei TaxID=29443 RepID=A0A4R3HTI1_PAULE|nr:EAL domain-containing protein [Paucimonas lemoignei]TCS36477.1 PAS domain S-box-containing protein/diguanylate cyclase (GGDEF)-like protein [Paucimonas lemoignei]
MAIAQRVNFRRLRTSIPYAALLAQIAGLVAAVLLFAALRDLEHKAQTTEFRQQASMRAMRLEQGLDDAVNSLAILNQLFVTNDTVSREQFRVFTAPLLARHPSIQAFNFHRIVPGEARAAYEAEMQHQFPGFRITELSEGKPVPARVRARHIVVDYLEPHRGNEAAFGLDVGGYSHLVRVMQQAADTGRSAASSLFQLAQGEGEARLGFEVVMPIYRKGAPLNDVHARRAAWIGDTAVIFSARNLIEKTFAGDGLLKEGSPDISVYAAATADETQLAFRKGNMPAAASRQVGWRRWFVPVPEEPFTHSFTVADKPWLLIVSPAQESPVIGQYGSIYVLIGGILFSLLAAAYIQALVTREQRVRKLVEERTQDANHANQLLREDIAARERLEHALELRNRAIEASPNAIIITSAEPPNYPIEYVNPAFVQMTGYSHGEILGKSMRILMGTDNKQPGIAEFKAATIEQRPAHAVIRSYRKDGTMFWNDLYTSPVRDASGKVTHFVAAQYDITDMKRYEAELEIRANRDTVTGLANRNLLRDRLSQALAYAARYMHPVWVVHLDLDRFKFINDTLGLSAGDELLKQVARRLEVSVRETDTVARLAADEFILVLPERSNESTAIHTMQRIMDAVAKPYIIEGHEFFMTTSAGMAVYPSDGEDAETLMKHADIAMYRAKETGRNNYQFYTPAMNERALERLRLEGDLRLALEHDQFELHYQPQVDLRTGRVTGMEALVRWQHPTFGMVAPARFIGLAEETGLIVPIGAWVICAACIQAKAWQDAGLGELRVAVNLSARQFVQKDLAASIASALQQCGLAPHCLEIELTESLIMDDVEHAIGAMRELAALGVHLSVDDFGTGYSSLSYLKRLPIHALKIDQSFVRDIGSDPDDAAIVATIISLAHSLRLQVIAEGVETAEQLEFLRSHGCDAMQGYYFSKPVPAGEFETVVGNNIQIADLPSFK